MTQMWVLEESGSAHMMIMTGEILVTEQPKALPQPARAQRVGLQQGNP